MIQKTLLITVGLAALGVLHTSEPTLADSPTGKVIGSFDWEETLGGNREGKATYEFDKESGEGTIKGFPESPAPIFRGRKLTGEDGVTSVTFWFMEELLANFTFSGNSDQEKGSGKFPLGNLGLSFIDFTATNLTIEHAPEPINDERDPLSHWSGDQSNDAEVSFDSENQTLSFGNMSVSPTLKLNDGSDSIADPLEGATITIGTSNLLIDIEQGWFLSNSTIEYLVGDVPVLTADLVNGFLFREGGEPQFDSELQYDLANISVNNFIDSPYLDGLQTYTENGNSSFLSFNSNILDLSNNLTISAISTGEISVDGKKVPEPSSTTTIFALGTLGAASTLKRKLKPSKSADKKLEKVS
uniref:hypothetical protein n=1 Tax=Okeania sp. SIO2F4 TaxID=2607790 RepID=UPI0025EC103F|nr:hypothetical protein [Okeania sp. SIO2F4]